MTIVKQNISLKKYNTFGINVQAKLFCEYNNATDIKFLIKKNYLNAKTNFIILGGGSNQLFTKDFDGLIIHPVNDKIEILEESETHILLKVDAGKNWDKFVKFCVENNYGGIENLSNIPGSVGASPVQNIGAYGVEAKDFIYEVNIVNLETGNLEKLNNKECNFAYRNSIFKNKLKNKYLVDSVIFNLQKNSSPNIEYGSLRNELEKLDEVNLSTVRETIIKVRESKLPDPEKIGNGGSFFKNPVIDKEKAEILLEKFPKMVTYPAPNNKIKIAAGWLIENTGLKGYINEKGTAGVHNKQALVLVNKGNATGSDIAKLAIFVKNKVKAKFDIDLEPEVIIN